MLSIGLFEIISQSYGYFSEISYWRKNDQPQFFLILFLNFSNVLGLFTHEIIIMKKRVYAENSYPCFSTHSSVVKRSMFDILKDLLQNAIEYRKSPYFVYFWKLRQLLSNFEGWKSRTFRHFEGHDESQVAFPKMYISQENVKSWKVNTRWCREWTTKNTWRCSWRCSLPSSFTTQ